VSTPPSPRELYLESLRALPTPQARETLCELPGVGEKTAAKLLAEYGTLEKYL